VLPWVLMGFWFDIRQFLPYPDRRWPTKSSCGPVSARTDGAPVTVPARGSSLGLVVVWASLPDLRLPWLN